MRYSVYTRSEPRMLLIGSARVELSLGRIVVDLEDGTRIDWSPSFSPIQVCIDGYDVRLRQRMHASGRRASLVITSRSFVRVQKLDEQEDGDE